MKKYFSNVENLNWWEASQLSVNKCGNLYTVLYKKMKDYSISLNSLKESEVARVASH